MEKNVKIYLGRGQEAHVRVTDISVSRLHAFILKSTQGYFYLCDNNSKFGTLVQVKTPLKIQPNKKVYL
jgi:pSer/pThr/pTyr-binding forkhead associated (FHA) protein